MRFCEVRVVGQQVDHIWDDIFRKEGDKFFCGEKSNVEFNARSQRTEISPIKVCVPKCNETPINKTRL